MVMEIILGIVIIATFLWLIIVSILLFLRLKKLEPSNPSTIFNWGINFWINLIANPYKDDRYFNFLVWQARITLLLILIFFIFVALD